MSQHLSCTALSASNVPPSSTNQCDLRAFLTMPRSGSWYHHYLFNAYNVRLSTIRSHPLGNGTEHPCLACPYPRLEHIGINLVLGHMAFPGFIDIYDGPHREKWLALDQKIHRLADYLSDILRSRSEIYPASNSNLSIVYSYRNPLDQALSLYNHFRNHKSEYFRDYVSTHSPAEFLHEFSTDIFIHQYFTFYALREQFHDQLMMLEYERMVKDRLSAFLQVLTFFKVAPADSRELDCAAAAVALTSIDKLKKVEKDMKTTLAGDQQSNGVSHMGSGAIGKWSDVFSDKDRDIVRHRLDEFDIDFNSFTYYRRHHTPHTT